MTACKDFHFTYEGEHGPDHWKDHCPDCGGKSQSLINITHDLSPPSKDQGPLSLTWPLSTSSEIKNTGHSIQVPYASSGGQAIFRDDPESSTLPFECLQYHFHCPSEHTINGASYDMEMHMVHKRMRKGIKEYLVVGVLFTGTDDDEKINPEVKKELEKITSVLPASPQKWPKKSEPEVKDEDDLIPVKKPLNPSVFVDEATEPYYYYNGSFTTPPCTEGVRWFVFPEAIAISQTHLKRFKAIHEKVNRPVQPVNKRPIKSHVPAVVSEIAVAIDTDKHQLADGAYAYLGIGGREFNLDLSKNDFEPKEANDPTNPQLSFAHVLSSPVYLRLDGSDECTIKKAEVTVKSVGSEDSIEYTLGQRAGIQLSAAGRKVYLAKKSDGAAASPKIKQIDIDYAGGNSPSNKGDYFLGIGGREFSFNNLSGTPTPTRADLEAFPIYISKVGKSDYWDLKSGTTIMVQFDSGSSIQLEPIVSDDLRMHYECCLVCFLKKKEDAAAEPADPNIKQITVKFHTHLATDAETNDYIYLGLAGREFSLDTTEDNFEQNKVDTFILAKAADASVNILDKDHNDPTNPQLSLREPDTYPAYLRKDGINAWWVDSVDVTVDLMNGNQVKYKDAFHDLYMDNDRGMICALKRVSP